jgi:hypothetical protein
MPGYNLFGDGRFPKFDLSTVRVYEVASPKYIPGAVSLADGTYKVRVASHREPGRDADKRAFAEHIAAEHGLAMREITVSKSLADMWVLL